MIIAELSYDDERRAAGAINRQWRARQMGVLAKMTGTRDNNLPQAPVLPTRPLSERAAQHAHDIEELETRLADAIRWGQEQETRARAAETALADARREHTYLANNRDSLLRDNAQLATLLASMSDLLDRAAAIGRPQPELTPVAQEIAEAAIIEASKE